MTKLPDRNLLEGTKDPETTTGEFRLAMGNLRQFLFDLFGDESSDKETARLTLGIDVAGINDSLSKKADRAAVEAVLEEKAEKKELAPVASSGSYNDLLDKPDAVPAGLIAMWTGQTAHVPDGWFLCDGNNGTPDLRDRFIVGAGSRYVPGARGGQPSFALSGATGETTLTINQIPSHTHSSLTGSSSGRLMSERYGDATEMGTTGATGGGASHSHSIAVSVPTLPPYYALCFIMKH